MQTWCGPVQFNPFDNANMYIYSITKWTVFKSSKFESISSISQLRPKNSIQVALPNNIFGIKRTTPKLDPNRWHKTNSSNKKTKAHLKMPIKRSLLTSLMLDSYFINVTWIKINLENFFIPSIIFFFLSQTIYVSRKSRGELHKLIAHLKTRSQRTIT